jgi:hypothetical protein
METVKETGKELTQRLRLYAEKASVVAIIGLAHRWTRVAVVTVFLLVSLWYMYEKMWQPFKDEVVLPLGVPEEKPHIDAGVLRAINSARAERSDHVMTDNSVKSGQVFTVKGI